MSKGTKGIKEKTPKHKAKVNRLNNKSSPSYFAFTNYKTGVVCVAKKSLNRFSFKNSRLERMLSYSAI